MNVIFDIECHKWEIMSNETAIELFIKLSNIFFFYHFLNRELLKTVELAPELARELAPEIWATFDHQLWHDL